MSDRTHEAVKPAKQVLWIKKSKHRAMQISGLIWCPQCDKVKISDVSGLSRTGFNFCCDGMMYSYEDVLGLLRTGDARLMASTGLMSEPSEKIY